MIEFCVHQNKFGIPNAWEELTPGLFEGIMTDMDLVTKGKLSCDGVGSTSIGTI